MTGSRYGDILERALSAPRSIPAGELAGMLACDDCGFEADLFAAAAEVKRRCGRVETLPRGLVECSNVCAKDCRYCGIRKSNAKVGRYRLTEDEARDCIAEARRRGYPAVAFQAGEVESEANTVYYERLLDACCGLEVTLSLGEQTEGVYRRWREKGALRYLLRIETSNPTLYAKLHPAECSFERRVGCLRVLKGLGYVTGTGVMIGLPGQTFGDLARDIVFFGEIGADMVGMGPWVPHPCTPLFGEPFGCGLTTPESRLRLSLRMIALVRLYLHGINVVSATALEALDPARGRARGISAGANVIMPELTPSDFRAAYDLYPGKA